MKVCVIPARSGSKRIPKKNIKIFLDKPMLAYAINIAKKSKLFDLIIVSTDNEEVSEIAKSYGAKIPFLRPDELANDKTSTIDVIKHAILQLERIGYDLKYICCLYPCVPLLSLKYIEDGLRVLQGNKLLFSFPVIEFASPISRAFSLDINGVIKPNNLKFTGTRSQDCERYFHDAGQFYWGTRDTWINKDDIHKNAIGIKLSRWEVVDIDNVDDWKYAELIYKLRNQNDQK